MYVKSNIDKYLKYTGHDYSVEEVSALNAEQFDRLALQDQIHIFNVYPAEYSRLTGKTSDATTAQDAPEPTPEDREKQFAVEFERRVDDAIRRAFHPNEP